MSIEMLSDGENFVNDDGDVLPVDRSNDDIPVPDHSELVKKYLSTSESDGTKGGGETEPTLSVNLADRAIAINGIMHIFNLQNRNRGANSKKGTQNIEKRYINSDSLLNNMYEKEKNESKNLDSYIDVLAATAQLKKAKISDDNIQFVKDSLSNDLKYYYGPGNAYWSDREKLVRKVRPPKPKLNIKK